MQRKGRELELTPVRVGIGMKQVDRASWASLLLFLPEFGSAASITNWIPSTCVGMNLTVSLDFSALLTGRPFSGLCCVQQRRSSNTWQILSNKVLQALPFRVISLAKGLQTTLVIQPPHRILWQPDRAMTFGRVRMISPDMNASMANLVAASISSGLEAVRSQRKNPVFAVASYQALYRILRCS